MLLSDIDKEKIALIFAHYAYRNTKVEDLHAGDSVLMDDAVYSEVYKIVSKKIRAIKRNNNFILEAKDVEDLTRKLRIMKGTRTIEISRYAMEMAAYLAFPYGTDWEPPKLLEGTIPSDLAAFILDGAFSERCDTHRKLDDKAMCYINKDIYNRFYTPVMKVTPDGCSVPLVLLIPFSKFHKNKKKRSPK